MAFTIDRRMINAAVLAALVYFMSANLMTALAVAVVSYLLTMF